MRGREWRGGEEERTVSGYWGRVMKKKKKKKEKSGYIHRYGAQVVGSIKSRNI